MKITADTKLCKVRKMPKIEYEVIQPMTFAAIREPTPQDYLFERRSVDMINVYHKNWGFMYSYAFAPEYNTVFIGV